MKIQLKINGEWAVLPPDFSLKMMKTSPLFSDQGDFSYPFELPVEPNRHIFGPIADPMGFVRLREFHALPAEIWFEGNQVFVGQTEISGEQTFSQRGKVSFNVVSNNGAFKDMISGLNCRDVKLKDQILLGWRPFKLKWNLPNTRVSGLFLKRGFTLDDANDELIGNTDVEATAYYENLDVAIADEFELFVPEYLFNESEVNVDKPYPQMPYCNVRMCCAQTKDESSNSESKTGGYGYKLYEPDGENRAPSFFVFYFLDCLFCDKTLDVVYDNSNVTVVEDLCRLAFFNAYPRFDDKLNKNGALSTDFLKHIKGGEYYYSLYATLSYHLEYTVLEVFDAGNGAYPRYNERVRTTTENTVNSLLNAYVETCTCYANGDNFPDTNVADVVSDLTNGFGIIFDYDQQNNFMKLHLVRDIMKSTEVDSPSCIMLKEPTITRSDKNGQILSYGENDDLNYNYAMPKGKYSDGSDDPVIINGFLSLSTIDRNRADAHTYYDESTGYAYRLRVDESTGNEPQFFPVGTNRDYKIGVFKENSYRNHLVFDEKENEFDTSDTKVYIDRDESNADKTELKFRPVVVNDVWSWYYNESEYAPGGPKVAGVNAFDYPQSSSDTMLCTFVDCEAFNNSIRVEIYEVTGIGTPTVSAKKKVDSKGDQVYHTLLGSSADMLKIEKASIVANTHATYRLIADGQLRIAGENSFDIKNNQHPLASANVGYQLGIMRGPGNKSNVEISYNYDDEGNDTWYNVVNSPTFTADSIDPYGNVFDYNGTEAGIGTEWETRHVTSNEALQHLNTMFPKSNVPFEEERAQNTGTLIHVYGQAGTYISFLVSKQDKDGNEVSGQEAISYIGSISKEVGRSITKLYDVDKDRKGIVIYGGPDETIEGYGASYVSLIRVYASGKDGDAAIKVDPMAGRLSLLLDARKVKEYDKDGNPVYFEVTDNTVARRGLVPQLLEDFLYFKAHHVKVTFPVLMSLSAINNLQLLKWNRFGDYVGLIKQVNYELTESGLRNVTVELLVANK